MPQRMPEGQYVGKLVKAGSGVNRNGTPLIWLTFVLTHCAREGQWAEMDGTTERDVSVFISDEAFDWAIDKLKHIGFNGDIMNPEFDPDLTEKGAKMICVHERVTDKKSGKERTYENWDLADWGTGGQKREALSQDDVVRFNARWKTMTAATEPPPDIPQATPPEEPWPTDGSPQEPPC